MEDLSQLPVPPSDDDDRDDEEETPGDPEGAEDSDGHEAAEDKPLDGDLPDDGGPRASEAERRQMLADLDLRARLVAFVRRKPAAHDRDPEDVAHDILIAAFAAARLP